MAKGDRMNKKDRRYSSWIAGVRGQHPCYGVGCDACPNRCALYQKWQEQKAETANRERLSQIDAEIFGRVN